MTGKYIYQHPEWPDFKWSSEKLTTLLASVRHKQGRLMGRMESLGFNLRSEAELSNLTLEITKSNEIEGELLNPEQVRSSLAKRLGIDISNALPSNRNIDEVVEVLLDATQRFREPLTQDRLFAWHSSMFAAGRSGMNKITVGDWRMGDMQVVSGGYGNEKVHFLAPDAESVDREMSRFLEWFNTDQEIDPVIKAGVAHLWFLTIHPFDDGNGRIGRAIVDMLLARADENAQRFYSMSAQIQKERSEYYHALEWTQKGALDISSWLVWFLECMERALVSTEELLSAVINKAKFWEHANILIANERQRTMLNKLLDGFEGKLTTVKWAKITKCSHDTALRDIQDLIQKGILSKDDSGGRSTAYILKAESTS